MDEVFKALADPTRRELLDRLRAENGQTLGQLCQQLDMSRQAVTKHLAILATANLVVTVWRGRDKLHYLNPTPINEIYVRWISKYERRRLQALSDIKQDLEKKRKKALMNKPEFVCASYIATTPEKLWEALISPEFTRQYWASRTIQSDWKVGSPVKLLKADGGLDWRGEILQSDPPRLLSYTFDPQGFLKSEGISEPPSRVTFEISQLGPEPTSKRSVVRLQVTHDNFEPDSAVAPAVSQGWPAILSSLKTLLESGRSLEFEWKC